jgi:ABC-2 type transport system permease protein
MEDKRTNFSLLLRLYALYARMDLAWFLRDTKTCLVAICADFISNIAAVTGVFLLAWRFDGVGGMNKFEVLFMLGYVTVITGVYQTFFSNCNTGHISRRIGRGQLEHTFLQPIPLPVQLLTEGFIPFSGSSNIVSGCIIIAAALKNLGIIPQWWWILSFVGNVAVTISIILSLSYIFSSAAFYAPVQAEEISSYVIDTTGNLSTYPLSGMSAAVQIPLITIFPAGLLGWFPSLAMLGRPPLDLPFFYPALVAILLFIIAVKLFRKGLIYYAKTGSNRYASRGHRR